MYREQERRRDRSTASSDDATRAAAPDGALRDLHRAAGNQAVSRMLAPRGEGDEVIRRKLTLRYGYTELRGTLPSAEATQLEATYARFEQVYGTLTSLVASSSDDGARHALDRLAEWKRGIEAAPVANDKQVRLDLTATIEERIQEAAELLRSVVSAAKQRARDDKVAAKLAEHADRVAAQASEAPSAGGVLYVAPSSFQIAGHDAQRVSSQDYASYQATATGDDDARHYMAGLTFDEQQFQKRKQVEDAEESVPEHRGHSGGYFESKYTPQQRASFDPSKEHGGLATPITDTTQTFHAGKHNPYQSDFNLKHRLTDAVPADSPTGAYTAVSSKFISDDVWLEALEAAKTAAAAALLADPDSFKDANGKFYKSYTVNVDLGKPVGVGFEADPAAGERTEIVDLFGNDVVEQARTAIASRVTPVVTTTSGAALAGAAVEAALTSGLRGLKAGESGAPLRTRIKTAVEGVTRSGTAVTTLSTATLKAIEGTLKSKIPHTFDDGDIQHVDHGFTGSQTGLTLLSIDPDGANPVWAPGAGQHYPAKTPTPSVVKYGNATL